MMSEKEPLHYADELVNKIEDGTLMLINGSCYFNQSIVYNIGNSSWQDILDFCNDTHQKERS